MDGEIPRSRLGSALTGKTGAFPMERSAYAKTSMIPGSFWIWVAGKSYLHDLVQAYK